jgi:FKBP-type peptidyl-prolyl cis-trans isomerase
MGSANFLIIKHKQSMVLRFYKNIHSTQYVWDKFYLVSIQPRIISALRKRIFSKLVFTYRSIAAPPRFFDGDDGYRTFLFENKNNSDYPISMQLQKSLVGIGIFCSVNACFFAYTSGDISRNPTIPEDKEEAQNPGKPELTDPKRGSVWYAAGYNFVHDLGLDGILLPGSVEATDFKNGAVDAITGNNDNDSRKFSNKQIQTAIQEKCEESKSRREEAKKTEYDKNMQLANDYLAKLKRDNKKINCTKTGLYYEVIKEGDLSRKVSANSRAKIKYTVKYGDGTLIDSSEDQACDIDLKDSIRGLQEGLQFIGKGGQIVLYIIAPLGYGELDLGGGCGAMLIFYVELVDVSELGREVSMKS